jgi:SAM-dependent methyltransferase/uncharacterized protein YbaR (Trm112 family)
VLRSHFELLRPVCPACRIKGHYHELVVNLIEDERNEDILAGILGCGGCGSEFPIIDGLPVLVPDVPRYVKDNLFYILARDDLTPAVESLLGDASGSGSGLESIRQYVSSYVWDHWADHDPQEVDAAPGDALPGSVARVLAAGLEMASTDLPGGPILDVGCGAGRSAVEAAALTGRQVLGIDVSTPLARVSRSAVVEHRIAYGRRRVGLVYDRRSFDLPRHSHGLVDIWICDALALPFAPGTFALAIGLNVLDCLADPQLGLSELGRVLQEGGEALLSVPFDWAGHVTPPERWIGGHSQRGRHQGNAEAILDWMLDKGALATGSLRRKSPARDVPWHVRLHERSCMHYRAHLVSVQRSTGQFSGKPAEEQP